MMKPDALQYAIEKYVEGRLNGDKLDEFQKFLQSNSSIAEEVRLSFEINETIKKRYYEN